MALPQNGKITKAPTAYASWAFSVCWEMQERVTGGVTVTPQKLPRTKTEGEIKLAHKNSLTLTQSIVVKCNLLQEAAYDAKQHIMYPAAKFWQVPHRGAHKKPVQKSDYKDDHPILAQQRGYCILSWTHQPDGNVMCYSEGPGGTA